jgi:hypothetical protein
LHPKITLGDALLKDTSSSILPKWQRENRMERQFLKNCCLKFEIQNRQQIASIIHSGKKTWSLKKKKKTTCKVQNALILHPDTLAKCMLFILGGIDL